MRRVSAALLRQMSRLDWSLPLPVREAESLVAMRVLRPDEVAVPGLYRVGLTSAWSATAEASRRGLAWLVEDLDARQEAALPVVAVLQARGHLGRLEWLRRVSEWRHGAGVWGGLSPPTPPDEQAAHEPSTAGQQQHKSKGPFSAGGTEAVAPDKARAAGPSLVPDGSSGKLALKVLRMLEKNQDGGGLGGAGLSGADLAAEARADAAAVLERAALANEAGVSRGAGLATLVTAAATAAVRGPAGGTPATALAQPDSDRVQADAGAVASSPSHGPAAEGKEAHPAAATRPTSPEAAAGRSAKLFSEAAALIRLRARGDAAGAWIQDAYTRRRIPTAVVFGPEALAMGDIDIVSNAFRRLWFVREDVDRVLGLHIGGLGAVYSRYSGKAELPGSARRRMSWEEWMSLCADCELVPHFVSDRVASAAFVWSAATQVSESGGADGLSPAPDRHSFVEFLESLARLAAAGEGMGSFGRASRDAVVSIAHAMRQEESRRRHRAAAAARRRRQHAQALADPADAGQAGHGAQVGGRLAGLASAAPAGGSGGGGGGGAACRVQAVGGMRVLLASPAAAWRDRLAGSAAASRGAAGGPAREGDGRGKAGSGPDGEGASAEEDGAGADQGQYGAGVSDEELFEAEDDAQRRALVDYLCRLDFACRAVLAVDAGGAPRVAAADS